MAESSSVQIDRDKLADMMISAKLVQALASEAVVKDSVVDRNDPIKRVYLAESEI